MSNKEKFIRYMVLPSTSELAAVVFSALLFVFIYHLAPHVAVFLIFLELGFASVQMKKLLKIMNDNAVIEEHDEEN